MRLGEEAGLRGRLVSQALTELRRGVSIEPEESGVVAHALGASRIIVSRVVPAPVETVRRAVDRFLREQLMTVRRHHGDAVEWERAQGIWPGLVRSLDFSKRYAFSLVSHVETVVARRRPDGEPDTSVTFNIDLADMRRERLTQMGLRSAMAFALLGPRRRADVPRLRRARSSWRSRAAASPRAASSRSIAGATSRAAAASPSRPSASSTCSPSATAASALPAEPSTLDRPVGRRVGPPT